MFYRKPARAFPYFGSKVSVIRRYPKPRHRKIIEPFAGSATYALQYLDHDVALFDLSPVVVGIWDYLIRAEPSEVFALPDVRVGDSIEEFRIPPEAKWLIGFWVTVSPTHPLRVVTPWFATAKDYAVWSPRTRSRLSLLCARIKHWKVTLGSYDSAPDVEATWFVDPPYQSPVGDVYPHKIADYARLGAWCRGRKGQVIACDGPGATWLPFKPLAVVSGRYSKVTEMIWTKDGA